MDAPERAIAEDGDVAIVIILTSSSIAGGGALARLLREVLAARGHVLAAIDECHSVDAQSMASFAPDVAKVGVVLDEIDVRGSAIRAVWLRPFRIGLTCTLPPVIRERVVCRLRLHENFQLVLGSIDRPDITLFPLPLERCERKGLVPMGVRALYLTLAAAPPWVAQGKVLIFCTNTRVAKGVAAALCKRRLAAWAYVLRKMGLAERERNRVAWESSARGIMVCTSTYGTGTSTTDVRLVITYGFAADPIEMLQHMGRPAREDWEFVIGVLCVTPEFALDRLQLHKPTPDGHAAAAGFLRVLRILFTSGCLRTACLREFGNVPLSCSGCDSCCRGGRCVDVSCGESLPELSIVSTAREAAGSLLESLRKRTVDGPLSLKLLVVDVPADAATPFNERTGHEMLCLALLGGRALDLTLHAPFHAGMNSVPHVCAFEHGLHAIRYQAAPTSVLLPPEGVSLRSARISGLYADSAGVAGWRARAAAARPPSGGDIAACQPPVRGAWPATCRRGSAPRGISRQLGVAGRPLCRRHRRAGIERGGISWAACSTGPAGVSITPGAPTSPQRFPPALTAPTRLQKDPAVNFSRTRTDTVAAEHFRSACTLDRRGFRLLHYRWSGDAGNPRGSWLGRTSVFACVRGDPAGRDEAQPEADCAHTGHVPVQSDRESPAWR
ncbi:P-loop containing nucleoside triphosphate hydrolase protein [Pavlovales sp. CCMP2436]|nr:P-loop containing nucleoside triphosphate hydrolase protein [Pavlovales sp. CCMP2436]